MKALIPIILFFTLGIFGCHTTKDQPAATHSPPQQTGAAPASGRGKTAPPLAAVLPSAPAATKHLAGPSQGKVAPPAPPVKETFEGKPKLSLFPRLGDFRPASNDAKRLPFWRTYIDHLRRSAGVIQAEKPGHGKIFSFRAIRGIDSLGFFSPLAVTPDTTYRVSFTCRIDLPKGASAGVGVQEFDRFLWIGEQFTQSLASRHQLATRNGVQLTGRHPWAQHEFTFTTGPRTHMIHLVLFREGAYNRQPVLFDDLSIRPVPVAAAAKPSPREQ